MEIKTLVRVPRNPNIDSEEFNEIKWELMKEAVEKILDLDGYLDVRKRVYLDLREVSQEDTQYTEFDGSLHVFKHIDIRELRCMLSSCQINKDEIISKVREMVFPR